ncbi:hypothetical protein [Nitratifractor sp.]
MKDLLTKIGIFTVGFVGVALYQILLLLTRPDRAVPYDIVRESRHNKKKAAPISPKIPKLA